MNGQTATATIDALFTRAGYQRVNVPLRRGWPREVEVTTLWPPYGPGRCRIVFRGSALTYTKLVERCERFVATHPAPVDTPAPARPAPMVAAERTLRRLVDDWTYDRTVSSGERDALVIVLRHLDRGAR